jgi:hypothetical protein
MDEERIKLLDRIKLRSDEYFITNLHMMYNKKAIMYLNDMEGTTIEDALQQKYLIEKQRRENKIDYNLLDDEFFGKMIDRLEKMFLKAMPNGEIAGGGGLEQLKDSIRRKINMIVPR